MTTREQKKSYNAFIASMIDKLPNINKWIRMFLIETFILFLSIRSRLNFLQLAKYGKYKEQRYRQQFEKRFDFLTFNKEFTLSQGSGRYAIRDASLPVGLWSLHLSSPYSSSDQFYLQKKSSCND